MKNKVFISYNRNDSAIATKLALQLSQSKDIYVSIDHWDMSIGVSLLDKIEESIDDSSFLIVLLSPDSVESKWVRTELKYAYLREEEKGTTFILPVLIRPCKMPIHVAGKRYVDISDSGRFDEGFQSLINTIRGEVPFSRRIQEFLLDANYSSPYNDKAQKEGRQILIDLGQHRELDVEEHQQFILWELFHSLLGQYKCTIKLGNNPYSNFPRNTFIFIVVDRWNERISNIVLSNDEFREGLWECDLDLMQSNDIYSSDLRKCGHPARLSSQRRYNQYTNTNPFLDSSIPKVRPILEQLQSTLQAFDIGSRQSFLYDLQSLIFSRNPHRVKIVVGSASDDLCLAFHSFGSNEHSKPSSEWAIFELYDPFFRSRKYTSVCPNHFEPIFEGDVDLMSPKEEVLLGPA